MHKRKPFVAAGFFVVVWFVASGSTVFAGGSHEGSINTNREGVAIEGYDPVAYFTIGEPTKGRSGYAHDWNGARWYFSSAEHRDRVAAEPEHYAPAVAEGNVAGIDPDAWHIENGRLYLNFSQRINRRFLDDLSGNIARAEENWPAIRERLKEAAADSSD